MFLEQAINRHNQFWKYIVGSVIIICASIIGQLPFGIVVLMKSWADKSTFPPTEEDLMNVLEPNLSLFLIMLSFVVAFVAIILVVKFLHKQSLRSVTTGRPKTDWRRIIFSFTLWSVISIVSVAVAYMISPEDYVWNFKPVPFAILVVLGIILIPIQTSTEEYIFRGYLMQGFANLAKNRWVPLVLTSTIFGLMHIANPEVVKMGNIIMIYYIGTGFFLGIMTLMDDGMELSLGFHAANNVIGALLVTTDWTAFQTHSLLKDISEPTAGADIIIPIFIVYPLVLLIFSRRYAWKDWRKKLTGKIEIYASDVSAKADGGPNIQ
ncbi:MAG: CPBP family intramembrane metalloprotease [Flavobacterium sp.]|nr:MAG: CPBP family intramembrane metalloprotease [Flavobacterium sp.]